MLLSLCCSALSPLPLLSSLPLLATIYTPSFSSHTFLLFFPAPLQGVHTFCTNMSIIFSIHRTNIFAIVPVARYPLMPAVLLADAESELRVLDTAMTSLLQRQNIHESTNLADLSLGMNIWLRGGLARLHAALFCQREEDTLAIEAAAKWDFYLKAQPPPSQPQPPAEGEPAQAEPAARPRLSAQEVATAFTSSVTGSLAAYFLVRLGESASGRAADGKKLSTKAADRKERLGKALTEAWATDASVKAFLASMCPLCDVTSALPERQFEEESLHSLLGLAE